MEYRYSGIILSKIDIAEVDRIYSVFTKEAGKIRMMGKGTRNPMAKLAGKLEPVTYSDIIISRSRGMGNITSVIVEENFSALKGDIDATREVFRAFSVVEKIITNEEKDERIFFLLLDFLKTMDGLADKSSLPGKVEIVALGFIFKLFDFSGYGMDMEACVKCFGKIPPEGIFFSATSGGVFCPECAPFSGRKIRITSAAIKLIRIFLKNKISNFVKISASREDIESTRIIAEEMERWVV